MNEEFASVASTLPDDWATGRFAGRIATDAGPTPVLIEGGRVYDMARIAATVAELIEHRPAAATGIELGTAEDIASTRLLAPVDLQCIKASGVTFAVSAIERVIEERARGDARAAEAFRATLSERVGADIRQVVPGSPNAERLKQALIADGIWSQYLEVAIGPDAEIFTKAPVLSAVGFGAEVGIRSDSGWNNPEPEVVLVVDPAGQIAGACLGNDVNLRDFEGRSALLLGKAKDNNASCAIGPMIRLFDDGFTMDDVRNADITLTVEGRDGFRLEGASRMDQISRDPAELARQALSEHQYPDGFVLFLGTLFAPTQDRDQPGQGFTHKVGDVVTVASSRLGTLRNSVNTSAAAAPWQFGIRALMRNLADRGLLAA